MCKWQRIRAWIIGTFARTIGELPLRKVFSSFYGGDKIPERAVVRTFRNGREETARKLPVFTVIRNTFATFSLAGAGVIRAGALLQIFLHSTFHFQIPFFCHRDHRGHRGKNSYKSERQKNFYLFLIPDFLFYFVISVSSVAKMFLWI
jgi:hypothetical protein